MNYPILATYTLQKKPKAPRLVRPVYIYYLCDPRDGRPRYVGRTVNPEKRLSVHSASWLNQGLSDWIADLKKTGTALQLNVLEIVTIENEKSAEREWMTRLADDGCDLLNRFGCIDLWYARQGRVRRAAWKTRR